MHKCERPETSYGVLPGISCLQIALVHHPSASKVPLDGALRYKRRTAPGGLKFPSGYKGHGTGLPPSSCGPSLLPMTSRN